MNKLLLYISVFIILFYADGTAQQYEFRGAFNIESGLPSNHIYSVIESSDGFLWIGTDNGISRFDGKRFVNYSTKNGLPSNDVIQVIKDKQGTVWANCYRQPPSYFDEKQNSFVSFENNEIVKKYSNSLLYPTVFKDGVSFNCKDGKLVFKSQKFISFQSNIDHLLHVNDKDITLKYVSNKTTEGSMWEIYDGKKRLLSYYNRENKYQINNVFENDKLYFVYDNYLLVCNLTYINNQLKVVEQKIPFQSEAMSFVVSESEITVLFLNSTALIFDKKTLAQKHFFKTNLNVTSYFKDSQENIYFSSIDNGLLRYTKGKIKNFLTDKADDSNLLSIHVTDENDVVTGNFQSTIFVNEKPHKILGGKSTWMRRITSFNEKIVGISTTGISINLDKNKTILGKNHSLMLSLKSGIKLNDSILIVGSIAGIYKLNILNSKQSYINSPSERILNLQMLNDNQFYFSANDGIYNYDFATQTYSLFFDNKILKNDNIECFVTDNQNKIWIYTTKGNLYLIKNSKIIYKIINSDLLPVNASKIILVNDELWIASKSGIYVLSTADLSKKTIRRISINDGLKSNFINDISYKNNFVYAATANGYSKIPIAKSESVFKVVPKLISIKINNFSRPIAKIYNLKESEKFVQLDIAAVDLTGHFGFFKYKLNNNEWVILNSNELNITLDEGKNTLKVHGVDSNGNVSAENLKLDFDVHIPFYKKNAFWSFVIIFFCVLVFLFFYFRKLQIFKREIFQQKALSDQRTKITADLHDEIGSTLSSLQINSSVANKLMKNDADSAQIVLQKVENQANSLAEKIGDIIWSMKPGKDEFMTLSTRIKNFCNEVLGSTNIDYTIKIDKKVDVLITDFAVRKNVLLITKEAINNALKYSYATKIRVSLRLENNKILVLIADNGKGFDSDAIYGNGIGNMKNRAKELNATFELLSNKDLGTSIKLEFNVIP